MFDLALLFGLMSALTAGPAEGWQSLAPGMDLKEFAAGQPSLVGDSRITMLRVDPRLWELEFAGISGTGETAGQTARDWCRSRNFAAAINAGIFAADDKTHIGYARCRGRVRSPRLNAYQSVAAFDPKRSKRLPPFRIFDLDAPGVTLPAILRDYASAVQNLRLIKRPGASRWRQQPRMWSEAALGEDSAGRILFIFCRSPFSMHDFSQELLASGIGLVAAQHLEGGPEAQLYLHVGNVERELFGSYETDCREDDGNDVVWPIPNILGVRPRSSDP
jgi:hypothetical protein